MDDRLKEAILRGELRPGEKLTAAALATRWNVSQTPLREAFQRLAAEGLVELRPQRGAAGRGGLTPRTPRRSTSCASSSNRGRCGTRSRTPTTCIGREIERAHERYGAAHGRAPISSACSTRTANFHADLLSRTTNQRLLALVVGLAEHSQWFQVLVDRRADRSS